ncbi:hypothetical protein SEA_DEJAVU_21 [Microbacterium Phage DejaVu]|nr:hypothetical protein SEA_DEJAVU_21 [Microbacterium Phage DejaVu]
MSGKERLIPARWYWLGVGAIAVCTVRGLINIGDWIWGTL